MGVPRATPRRLGVHSGGPGDDTRANCSQGAGLRWRFSACRPPGIIDATGEAPLRARVQSGYARRGECAHPPLQLVGLDLDRLETDPVRRRATPRAATVRGALRRRPSPSNGPTRRAQEPRSPLLAGVPRSPFYCFNGLDLDRLEDPAAIHSEPPQRAPPPHPRKLAPGPPHNPRILLAAEPPSTPRTPLQDPKEPSEPPSPH